MSHLHIKSFIGNEFQEQCYVVWDENSCHCLLVDPGFSSIEDWQACKRFLISNQLEPERLLITHSHTDHVMGTGFVKNDYPQVLICGSVDDQNRLPSIDIQNRLFGMSALSCWSPINCRIVAGEEWLFPSEDGTELPHRIQVIDCPGHSFHGLCYYFPDDALLFSGDVLFCYSIGRSDFGPQMGCDGLKLVEGIVNQLLTLPKNVVVYPGHGPMTTIGDEAKYNPYLR